MSYKEIVVHADSDDQFERRLAYASQLCNAYGARLTGVCALIPPFMPAYMAGMPAPSVIEAQIEFAKEEAAKTEERFWAVTRAAKIDAQWTQSEGYRADVVGGFARYADIVLASQGEPSKSRASTEYDVPAELIMGVGRPVLTVPYVGDFEAPPSHVAVAWSATREAARAVADTMPLLVGAEKVSVISVNEAEMDEIGYESPSKDLTAFLQRHGVKASAEPISADDIDFADLLLSRVSDFGADMIVMGGYGHARMRQLVMGGATHDILRHMTVPVVMSH